MDLYYVGFPLLLLSRTSNLRNGSPQFGKSLHKPTVQVTCAQEGLQPRQIHREKLLLDGHCIVDGCEELPGKDYVSQVVELALKETEFIKVQGYYRSSEQIKSLVEVLNVIRMDIDEHDDIVGYYKEAFTLNPDKMMYKERWKVAGALLSPNGIGR